MAQPIPYFVSPSTTFVQVESLQTPYTPAILNTIQFAGQVVTVIDGTSSFQVLQTPIVVSTGAGTFEDGTISTLINQPQGYITVQSQLPTTWNFLNSYPFRNQYVSAGALNVTASTSYTALVSSVYGTFASAQVENLIVTSQFFQSTGITLNTNISTFGTVDFLSSIGIFGNVFFSSQFSTVGSVNLFSSLFIQDDLHTTSSIRTTESIYISDSMSVIGPISTGLFRLRDGIQVSTLEVQASSISSVFLAGSLDIQQNLSTLGSLLTGGDFYTDSLTVQQGLTALSTFTLGSGNVRTTSLTPTTAGLVVGGSLSTLGSISVGTTAFIVSTLKVESTPLFEQGLRIQDSLDITGLLSTSFLSTGTFSSIGTLNLISTNAFLSSLEVGTSLGAGFVLTYSTFVGRTLSTLQDLQITGGGIVYGNVNVAGSISTLQSLSVGSYAFLNKNLSIGKDFYLSSGLNIGGNLNVLPGSLFTNTSGSYSTVIEQNLNVFGNLNVNGTLTISSLTLPSSILASNITVSTLHAGHQGIVSTSLINTLYASSILASTSFTYPRYTLDLGDGYLSTGEATVKSYASTLVFNTENLFMVTSTIGVGIDVKGSEKFFETNEIGYFLSSLFVDKLISTNDVYASQFTGTFVGDATNLSNLNYPFALSPSIIDVSTLSSFYITTSSFFTSTAEVLGGFSPISSLQVGDIYFYGDFTGGASNLFYEYPLLSTLFVASRANIYPQIMMNNMDIRNVQLLGISYPGSANPVLLINNGLYSNPVNGEFNQTLFGSNYSVNPENLKLVVGLTMRFTSITSPELVLSADSIFAETAYASTITPLAPTLPAEIFPNTMTLYVSSGLIGKEPSSIFISPPIQTPLLRSTNTIETHLSTLIFNSTLFIERDTQRVGINTKPNFDLDVPGITSNSGLSYAADTTFVKDQIRFTSPNVSSFWFAISDPTPFNSFYGLQESYNGESWSNSDTTFPFFFQFVLPRSIAYSGSNWLLSYSDLGPPNYAIGDTGGSYFWVPNSPGYSYFIGRGSAWNGEKWVMVGSLTNGIGFSNTATINYSIPTGSALFPFDFTRASSIGVGSYLFDSNTSNVGGQDVAWNGKMFVAVGDGVQVGPSRSTTSIQYSYDGMNWSGTASGGFDGVGRAITWTGNAWLAFGQGSDNVGFYDVLRSTDGSNWQKIHSVIPLFNSQTTNDAIATPNIVVATGADTPVVPGTAGSTIKYSLDGGYTWSNATGQVFSSIGYALAYNGDYWLAGGQDGIRKSYDGKDWFYPPGAPTYPVKGFAYSSNTNPAISITEKLVEPITLSTMINQFVVGANAVFSPGTTSIRYSGVGDSFSNTIGYTVQETVYSVAYGEQIRDSIVEPCYLAGGSQLYTSAKGYTVNNVEITDFNIGEAWALGPTFVSNPQSINGLGYGKDISGNPLWIATGQSNAGQSTNIYFWNAIYGSGFSNTQGLGFSGTGTGVAYNGSNLWVAVGCNYPNSILYSSDGWNWSNNGVTNEFNIAGYAVTYGSNTWVAIGASYDEFSTMGVGTSTIKYSGDGSNWSDVTNYFKGVGIGGVTYGSSLFVAVGNDGLPTGVSTIKYSGDAINWSDVNPGDLYNGPFDNYGTGVAFNSTLGTWVATGQQGGGSFKQNIIFTSDITTWYSASPGVAGQFNTVATSSREVTYSITPEPSSALLFYENPNPGVTNLNGSNRIISYPSSILSLNDSLFIDSFRNIEIGSYITPYSAQQSSLTSTLYVFGNTFISTYICTPSVQVNDYYLGSQFV